MRPDGIGIRQILVIIVRLTPDQGFLLASAPGFDVLGLRRNRWLWRPQWGNGKQALDMHSSPMLIGVAGFEIARFTADRAGNFVDVCHGVVLSATNGTDYTSRVQMGWPTRDVITGWLG
jgi:hypothetical protein